MGGVGENNSQIQFGQLLGDVSVHGSDAIPRDEAKEEERPVSFRQIFLDVFDGFDYEVDGGGHIGLVNLISVLFRVLQWLLPNSIYHG